VQAAGKLQELRPGLGLLDVPVELVLDKVVDGEQMPDPVRSGVDRPSAGPGLPVGILVPAATFDPLRGGAS